MLTSSQCMSAKNPFQIPDCFKLDLEQRRRERFKKTVVTAVIVSAALVVGLLIEGCVSEKSQASSPWPSQTPAQAPQKTAKPVYAQQTGQTEQPISRTNLPLQPCPVAMVPKTTTPVLSLPTTGVVVYLVKSGDSLTRIAKTQHTTIKALKAANHLASDRINVGQKLTIPTA